jgi:hypothetical protein
VDGADDLVEKRKAKKKEEEGKRIGGEERREAKKRVTARTRSPAGHPWHDRNPGLWDQRLLAGKKKKKKK